MNRSSFSLRLGIALVALVWNPGWAMAQVDYSRRELATPGLILEPGSRTSACDVLAFTNGGRFLFATGDDKVVRTWKFNGKGLEIIPDPAPAGVPKAVLRWTSHRERRGNIYAAAVSPDAKYIAIGGMGIRNSQLAVLDRFTGEIKNALPYLSDNPKLGGQSIWSMAFSPSGDQVACGTGGGAVFVWDWKNGKTPVLVGQHANQPDREFNYVRFVDYDNGNLVSADEQGGVYRWKLGQSNQNGTARIFTYSNHDKPNMLIRFFAQSPDSKWLAAALEINRVEIRSLNGGGNKTITFDMGNYPSALAYDPKGNKLAVSLRKVDTAASFFKEIGHKVAVYDVSANPPKLVHEITPNYRIEALAFHPDGKHLATAGGNNHDVNVYDLANTSRPLGPTMAGPGECIWGVSISKDGRYLGYQTTRNKNPDHPNHRGNGTRIVFDLQKRLFAKENGAMWAPLHEKSADGWEVLFSTPQSKHADKWFVKGPNGAKPIPIPWDTKVQEFPRCYTFLPRNGKGPTRLVVGHLYGASVYELTKDGVHRTRILTGHDAEVNGLALSADGKRLITASRDQTIAGWSLEDWPSHPQLGANLFVKGGRLYCGVVDTGSPLWEAGLSSGDEVIFVVVEGKIVYNNGLVTPSGMKAKLKDTGSAEAALQALQRPKAGGEIYFGWKRPGEGRILESLTYLRDRPIWRFFPTKDREWVLWRYQDFLYDTSTKGDTVIGWQRNMLDAKGGFNVKGTPEFYRAEQFRNTYHSPEKVTQTLLNWSRSDQGKSSFVEIEPGKIELLVDGAAGKTKVQVKDKGFSLSIKVTPKSERQNQELTRVILWINDYQFKKWENGALQKHITLQKNGTGLARGVFEVKNEDIPLSKLRSGENVIFVQSYNKADVRGDSERIAVTNVQPRPQANLHGFFVGVGDYRKSFPKQANLGAPEDADVLSEVWERNRGKLYAKAKVRVLKDKQITPTSVLKAFDGLEKEVRPDDLLVFHLGGHGVSKRKMAKEVQEAKLPGDQLAKFNQQLPGLGQFFFLCGDFNFLRIRDTTISLDDLYEKLVKLPCHKLIILDACNSAAVDPNDRKRTDIIRLFTKDGVGPIIFAACKAEESAIEFPGFIVEPASGLFAQAIVKTIDEDFNKADLDKDGILEPGELFLSLKTNVEKWVKELRLDPMNKDLSQNPQFFLPTIERNFAILMNKKGG